MFFLNVLIQKIGTTVGFVGLFVLGQDIFEAKWFLYSMLWVAMYTLTEIGQALLPNYSKKVAVAGIVSGLFYFS